MKKILFQFRPAMKWVNLIALPNVISFAILTLSRQRVDLTEMVYSRRIFPFVSIFVSYFGSLISFSLAFFVLALAVILAVLWMAAFFYNLYKQRFHYMKKLTLILLSTLSFVLLFFSLASAPNYNRLTFGELAGLEIRESSGEELAALCIFLVNSANEQAKSIQRNSAGYIVPYDFYQLSSQAKSDFDNLSNAYPFLNASLLMPKPFLASEMLSVLQLTGFYFPYTGEANVNDRMPIVEIPFTMLHELSHTVGFMREDEANFMAWLAGRESASPIIRYSAFVCALNHFMNALYSADANRYFFVLDGYSNELMHDVRQMAAYWESYESPAATVADRVNDAY